MRSLAWSCLLAGCLLAGCAHRSDRSTPWYPQPDPRALERSPQVDFIPGLKGYQQTTEYTCGPSALMAVASLYGVPGITLDRETELRIAREAGAHDPQALAPGESPGLSPEAAAAWLRAQGLVAELAFEERGDYSGLARLRKNIREGIPTLVAWIGYGEHWVIAVGYDDRGTPETGDDVILFADSADVCDDYQDGYTFANADKFYWCWFDVLYYNELKWRPMIEVRPAPRAR